MKIRAATMMDGPAIFPLAKQLATSSTVEAKPYQESFAAILSMPEAVLLVAEKEDKPLGFLLGFKRPVFYANGWIGWVEELAVEEAERGKGTGTALMKSFEGWCAEQGCKSIAVATRRAGSFYQKLGYEDSAVYFKKKF